MKWTKPGILIIIDCLMGCLGWSVYQLKYKTIFTFMVGNMNGNNLLILCVFNFWFEQSKIHNPKKIYHDKLIS